VRYETWSLPRTARSPGVCALLSIPPHLPILIRIDSTPPHAAGTGTEDQADHENE
jgi:hypothetical protein